ncbi:hypothetical protein QE152_g22197 [Popillia japonica]|uniref:Uncharacterized protein n=1 Tax=Popillia japonica TaxID=7064 RepID=A0AAW1KLP1_POPJA
MTEKPARNKILESLQTLQRFAQTTAELNVNFEDNLAKLYDNEEMTEKPARNKILESLQTLQRFAQTTAELNVNFEDNLDKVRREYLKNCTPKYNQQKITNFLTSPTEH